MATVKCKAVELGIVPRRGAASLEWWASGKPQHYCHGYTDAMNDELIEPCQSCPDHVGKAQSDYEKYLSAIGILVR